MPASARCSDFSAGSSGRRQRPQWVFLDLFFVVTNVFQQTGQFNGRMAKSFPASQRRDARITGSTAEETHNEQTKTGMARRPEPP